MTFERTTYRDIAIGAPVFTLDNEKLGEVKEIRGDAFKVAALMRPDYWLPTSCLADAGRPAGMTERLIVNTDKDHVGDLKVDQPRK